MQWECIVAVVLGVLCWSLLFSLLASERKCIICSNVYLHVIKEETRKQEQNFPLKIHFLKHNVWKVLEMTEFAHSFSFFSCCFCAWRKAALLSLDLCILISPALPCQQSLFSSRWSEKKNDLGLLFAFFSCFHVYKGWMNFWCLCMLVSCWLVSQ